MRFKQISAAVVAVSTAFGVAGCGSSSNNNSVPQSRVRVLNGAGAATAGQPVDVFVNGTRVFSNVGFGASSARVEVPAGTAVPIVVQNAGTGVTIATGTANITHSVDQTLLVTGALGGVGAQAFQAVALPPEDLSSTPTSGQVRLYFVNAAIHTTAPGSTATFAYTPTGGATVTVPNVNFAEMSAAQLPQAGTYTITATVAGVTATTTATLTGGKTYTVFLTGRTPSAGGSPPLTLQVIQDN